MDDPAHDLVIGNIEGSKFPDMTHFSSGVVKISSQGKIGERIERTRSQISLLGRTGKNYV